MSNLLRLREQASIATKIQKSITSSIMPCLKDELKVELTDQWHEFGPINKETYMLMSHFDSIFNDWVADSDTTVPQTQWLPRMRPENSYKFLLNEGNLSMKELFVATFNNLKSQRSEPPHRLPGDTRISIKVAHKIFAFGTHRATRADAGNHIKDIWEI